MTAKKTDKAPATAASEEQFNDTPAPDAETRAEEAADEVADAVQEAKADTAQQQPPPPAQPGTENAPAANPVLDPRRFTEHTEH